MVIVAVMNLANKKLITQNDTSNITYDDDMHGSS